MLTVVQDRLATKKEGSKQGGGVAAPLRLEWTQFTLFHPWCPPIKRRKAPNIQMQRKGETWYLPKRGAFSKVVKLKQFVKE